MSDRPEQPAKEPEISKPLQFLAVTGLALFIAGAVYAMRHFGVSTNNVSMATTIATVGSLLMLTKRYGTRSIPVLTLMFWVLVAAIAIFFAAGK